VDEHLRDCILIYIEDAKKKAEEEEEEEDAEADEEGETKAISDTLIIKEPYTGDKIFQAYKP